MFTAVHVKKDGKWKIRELVETPAPVVTAGERLSELAWLVGDWNEADKDAGLTVKSHYQWARGGNFISRNVTVKRGENPVLEGWQIIGWDPVEETIRSWTFDDAGGHSGGFWTREGQRWLVRETGYAPDLARDMQHQPIDARRLYRWQPSTGFTAASSASRLSAKSASSTTTSEAVYDRPPVVGNAMPTDPFASSML